MIDILPIPDKTEITIIDILYYEQFKHHNTYERDVIFIIYRVGDGPKQVHRIVEPEMEYYMAKDETRTYSTPREYVEFKDVYPIKCKSKFVVNDIIKQLKNDKSEVGQKFKKIVSAAYETNNRRALKEVHKYPYVFMSDLKCEDYYRIMTSFKYNTEHIHKFRKAYADIEADIFGLTDYQLKRNEDKINAITVIFDYDPSGKTTGKDEKSYVYTFLLRDYERYPQQKEFEKNLKEFEKLCHSEFDEVEVNRGGKKIKLKTNAKYHFIMCDTEAELLTKKWQLMHAANPDTVDYWNIAYDIPKQMARAITNGINPVDMMSHPVFPKSARFVDVKIDSRANIGHADRKTYIKCTNMFRLIDQMLQYAAANKGLKDYGSNELDNIAMVELGWEKRKFTKAGVSIRNAAIESYLEFVLYGIQDVWIQFFVDKMTQHTDTIMMDSNASASGVENIYKQTQYLRNLYYLYRLNRGYVSSNNVNTDYISGWNDEKIEELEAMKEYAVSKRLNSDGDEDDEDDTTSEEIEEVMSKAWSSLSDGVELKHRLAGGLVGNPNLNSHNGESLVKGIRSKHVFRHCMDQDYGSEYPNAKITRNISKSTQAWRIVIQNRISERQNVYENEKYIPGGEYLADYISRDFISMGNVWHGLPTTDECIKEFIEKVM